MTITCTRRIQFCAGHRVHGHEGKCRHLHGHNYVAWFTAEADELDNLGRVIDFTALKGRLGSWVDENWDHGFIVWERDEEAKAALALMPSQKKFELPTNPTAENMADHLLRIVGPDRLKGTGVRLVRVVIDETENCSAEVIL